MDYCEEEELFEQENYENEEEELIPDGEIVFCCVECGDAGFTLYHDKKKPWHCKKCVKQWR